VVGVREFEFCIGQFRIVKDTDFCISNKGALYQNQGSSTTRTRIVNAKVQGY